MERRGVQFVILCIPCTESIQVHVVAALHLFTLMHRISNVAIGQTFIRSHDWADFYQISRLGRLLSDLTIGQTFIRSHDWADFYQISRLGRLLSDLTIGQTFLAYFAQNW